MPFATSTTLPAFPSVIVEALSVLVELSLAEAIWSSWQVASCSFLAFLNTNELLRSVVWWGFTEKAPGVSCIDLL